ncbi:MAG: hypothetical protein M5U09_04610, partial [Gammaproteobacteria bacterium]|nr:hypothetical protein [Gammaproteobacteria bacterium]
RHYAAADVFVFPSRTDTFGVVMLRSDGVRRARGAYPVTGPIDVVSPGVSGSLNEDLATAMRESAEDRSRVVPEIRAGVFVAAMRGDVSRALPILEVDRARCSGRGPAVGGVRDEGVR